MKVPSRSGPSQWNVRAFILPAITIPENALSVTIGSDGTVSVRLPGSSAISQIGNVQLADFVNPAGLQPIGDNLYLESSASGSPQSGNPGLNGVIA